MIEFVAAIKGQMEASEITREDTIGGPRFVTDRLNALMPDGMATLRIEKDNEQDGAIHSVMFTFELHTPDTDGLIWRDRLLTGRAD